MNHPIIVFDIDGTLTDSVRQHQTAFEAALRRFQFPLLRTDWSSYRHHTDSGIFDEACSEASWDKAPELQDLEMFYRQELDKATAADPIIEVPGASVFVKALRQAGCTTVFATGSLRYGAVRKLMSLHVDYDDDLLVTASEHKTREEIVSAAVEKGQRCHGVSAKQRIVSVGDGIWGLKTARNLALEFVGIGSGQKADLLRQNHAQVFPDFLSGLGLVERMTSEDRGFAV